MKGGKRNVLVFTEVPGATSTMVLEFQWLITLRASLRPFDSKTTCTRDQKQINKERREEEGGKRREKG